MSDHAKELYRQLRLLPWEKLWVEEVGRFNRAGAGEREKGMAVIRAVGVVFAEAGAVRDKEAVRKWLLALLRDPSERIRRYAAAALPKIGAGTREEGALLTLLNSANSPVEKKHALEALAKIGGAATLEALQQTNLKANPGIEQKLKAGEARRLSPSVIRMDRVFHDFGEVRLQLRGRPGLESIVRKEVEESLASLGKFRVEQMASGLVELKALGPFSLADVYALRCFGTVGFTVGRCSSESAEGLVRLIASPAARRVLASFTEGTIRYRLDYATRGHQRAAVRDLAARVYALCPEILNDAKNVTWTVDVYQEGEEQWVELRPNMTPDPRFQYRLGDVPAASHPPLAACMARVAGPVKSDIVWDPFCGSGLELIECALLGGVQRIVGTDRSASAIETVRKNSDAAKLEGVQKVFICGDFREAAKSAALGQLGASLIITNPPMGIRVPVSDRRGLMYDLFSVAAKVLRPGGRLVLVNPLPMEPSRLFERQFQQEVEMGGFRCRLEKYVLRAR